ncbi:hypothetical protein FSP39_003383 [Pinctada imbricata]|uniref:CCHC-type domain-containing protein n=1 Tax=Pinctada imbricata TaxID=66713 RepID=A0AA89CAG5_PINIB|nr:hypothetical protein FSP39_003383 [Pinctada imbricata]
MNPGTIHTDEDGNPTIRVRVKNVPLSADDGQIKRALEQHNCEIISMFREKLRIDGRLTNCETGDRIVIIGEIDRPLPTTMTIGRYSAIVLHKGQPNDKLKCNKCLQKGHTTKECPNEVICRSCNKPGHIMAECPEVLHEDSEENADDSAEEEEENVTTPHEVSHKTPSSSSLNTKTVSKSSVNKHQKDAMKSRNKSTTGGTSGKIDNFVTTQPRQSQQKNTPTPSRKSTTLSHNFRSPPTPVNEMEARVRNSKKTKEGP